MYLKNRGGYKQSHFKGISYEDIRPIFERSSKKRSRKDSDEDNAKKQKLEDDAEKKELRDSMDVIRRDDIAIDVESLATKYPIARYAGSTQTGTRKSNTTAKLPILKLGEYKMWVIRIKQYFQNGTSVTKMSVPVTAEEKTNKKNDVKARSLLLMALPNEHQLTFSQYSDAKTMLQKIVSRLAILGVVITQEDLNSKFLRSLPPEWNTHVVVWMNKADIKTMSIDDLYNNFKIIEQDVKKSVGAMRIHEDDLEAMDLKWQLSLLSMRAKRYFQRTGKKIFINANDTAGMINPRIQGNNEEHIFKGNVAINGVGFDKSDIAEEQVQTNMSLMAFPDSEILLKIPRKDNMYSFDMKNIVPKESLTCLVAKATSDESSFGIIAAGIISNESASTQGELNVDVGNDEPNSAANDQKQLKISLNNNNERAQTGTAGGGGKK
ncbi:hypothetical protein Tco_0710037 [Tanacetum coccineum]